MANWFDDDLYAAIVRYHSRKRSYALYRDPFACLAVLLSVLCIILFVFLLCWTARRSAQRVWEDVRTNPRLRGDPSLRKKKTPDMQEAEPFLNASQTEEGLGSLSIQSKESLDVVRYDSHQQDGDEDDSAPLVGPRPSLSNAHKIPRKPVSKDKGIGKQVRFSTLTKKYEKIPDASDSDFEDISNELQVDDNRESMNERQMRELYLH